MIKRLVVGLLAVGVVLFVVLAKYIAPLVLAMFIGLTAWASQDNRNGFLLLFAVLILGVLGIAAYSAWERARSGRKK